MFFLTSIWQCMKCLICHVSFLHLNNCCLLMEANTVYSQEHNQGFLALWHSNLTYFSLNLLKSVIQIETFQLLILKEWELARNIQRTHASILGAAYEREGERICVSVVTLCGYEFVFPSGNFIFQFQSQSCLLTRSIFCLLEKPKQSRANWDPWPSLSASAFQAALALGLPCCTLRPAVQHSTV